jgi:5-methylcytosine-specific restriction endonuclease McrA
MKKKIRERDNYNCRLCNAMKTSNVHHIIPNGKANSKNLILLCNECHAVIHKLLAIDRKWKSVGRFMFNQR